MVSFRSGVERNRRAMSSSRNMKLNEKSEATLRQVRFYKDFLKIL